MTDYGTQLKRTAARIEGAFNAPTGDTTDVLVLSTASAAQTGLTKDAVYRLWCDVNCFVIFTDGGSTAATTNCMPITAELPEWFVLKDVDRIAAIVATGSGNLYISKMG